MTAVIHAIRRALVGTGSTALTLIGALLIGFGVPLFWIWIASQFYDKPGAVNGSVAAFIGTGTMRQAGSSGDRLATANPDTTKNSTRLPTLAHTKIGKAESNSGGSVTTNTM